MNETFDRAHAASVIEHVLGVEKAFEEINRVLKPEEAFWFSAANSMTAGLLAARMKAGKSADCSYALRAIRSSRLTKNAATIFVRGSSSAAINYQVGRLA